MPKNWVKHIFTKLLFWDFIGKKTPSESKIRFSKFYEEWKHDMFLIFWMKSHHHKIALNIFSFLRKILF